MKYEFHPGDYVETKTGSIGRVSAAKTWYSSVIGDDVICLSGNVTRNVSCGFVPFSLNIAMCDVPKYFNLIGQYDFTKKDEGKIEFIDGVDTTNPIDSPFIIDKINKLIEAVNELREKVYE